MEISPEMLICGDITSCTKLTHRNVLDQISTLWLNSTWQQLLYRDSIQVLLLDEQYVTQFGKTKHNAHLLILVISQCLQKIFFGEEVFFALSYNMITHGSFDTKNIVVSSALWSTLAKQVVFTVGYTVGVAENATRYIYIYTYLSRAALHLTSLDRWVQSCIDISYNKIK